MDDRRQRLVIDGTIPDHTQYFGREVTDSNALDGLAARLEKADVMVRREPAALADQRFASDLISFHDPAGNRLEAFHGAAVADTPLRPSRLISGFRAGPLGMGHVLLVVQDIAALLAFYCDLLGFKISDYMRAYVGFSARTWAPKLRRSRRGCQIGIPSAVLPNPSTATRRIVDEDDRRILGAYLVRLHADEIINLFALAIRHDLATDDVKSTIFGYPTGASDIGYML